MKPKFTDRQKYPNGYDPSHDTDIRRRFERIARERKANAKEAEEKVEPLTKRKTAA